MPSQPAVLRMLEKTAPRLVDLPTVRAIFEGFANSCAATLKQVSELEANFVLAGLALGSAADLAASAGDAASVMTFIPEWNEYSICRIDSLLLFRVLDAMYGGDAGARIAAPNRGLTGLERALAVRLARALMTQLAAALDEICPFVMRSERIVEEVDWSTLSKSKAEFILVQMTAVEFHDTVTIGIPSAGMEFARDRLAVDRAEKEMDLDPTWTSAFRRNIASTSITLLASAAGPNLLLSDVARLQPGSMLEFDGSRLRHVLLKCAERPVFVGRLGQSKGAFTICLEAPASGDDDASRGK